MILLAGNRFLYYDKELSLYVAIFQLGIHHMLFRLNCHYCPYLLTMPELTENTIIVFLCNSLWITACRLDECL
jgi:hypothetical protein